LRVKFVKATIEFLRINDLQKFRIVGAVISRYSDYYHYDSEKPKLKVLSPPCFIQSGCTPRFFVCDLGCPPRFFGRDLG
jgi:hypothetical protein